MRAFRKGSSKITVGDRPVDDFPIRMAQGGDKRAIAAESRDWMLVRSLLHSGERSRCRVAVRFPEERNAAGHAFVTDQRVMFEFHERVLSLNLATVVFLGRPARPSSGDFVVEALVLDGPGAGRFTITMRIRDLAAFHDFFPTLLDAARSAGAQPEVDASWGGTPSAADAPMATEPTAMSPPADTAPSDDAVEYALAAIFRPEETIVAAADMVHNLNPTPVTVLVTEGRLVMVDGSVIWAADLARTTLVDGGGRRTHLRLMVDSLDDWRVLGGGAIGIDPSEQRRLVLRARADQEACEVLHGHLAQHAGAVLPAWPGERDGAGP